MRIIKKYNSSQGEVGIIELSEKEQKEYKMKKYEAVWRTEGIEGLSISGTEWNSFGGSVGFDIADFDTIRGAERFIKKGLRQEKENPEIWLEMVACV